MIHSQSGEERGLTAMKGHNQPQAQSCWVPAKASEHGGEIEELTCLCMACRIRLERLLYIPKNTYCMVEGPMLLLP